MKKVFIVHGFRGEPNGGWRPWLMSKLAEQDVYACSLPMPTPSKPEVDKWVKTIRDAVETPTQKIFLVGHSLGVPALLHYMEQLNDKQKIGGVVLVSGPAFVIKRPGYTRVNKFLDKPFNFKHLKKICKNFTIIHGDNDMLVPFSHAQYLSDNLSGQLVTISKGGHLNGSAGWYALPELLIALEKMF